MHAILITTSSFGSQDSRPRDLLHAAGLAIHTNPFGRTLTEAEAGALLREHRPIGIIAGVEPLTAAVLNNAAGHLKVISRCGTGLDNVDMQTAADLGIAVYNTPEAPSQAVAELTVAMMLGLIRKIGTSDRLIRAGMWKKPMGSLLSELTVGIIGLGRIGKRVACLAGGFGAPIIASDLKPDEAWAAQHRVRLVARGDLLRQADIVTLHLPYATGELHHLIGSAQLADMKPGSYLINTSRGGLVDENALYDALKSGHLGGAALDTFECEPYDGALLQLENVILSPHVGSYAKATRVQMELEAAENLLRGVKAKEVA